MFIAGILKKKIFFSLIMILYAGILLNILINSNYLYIPQNFLCTKSYNLQIKALLLSDAYVFDSFPPLLSWLGPSAQYWIKLVIVDILIYFFDLVKKLSVFDH